MLGIVLVAGIIKSQASNPKSQIYLPPMSHEISLAGNFGEPRPNHFHGGLDFRTEGVEGKCVMAIGDGYVSRISVGLSGFGNAVYVTHPEGYTSVYCHLQRFSPRLERLLRRWQYEHEQWEADVRLSPIDCPVSQGQLIAFSGNTGYSFGPHLHLEIHDTRSWDMLDPLEFLGAYVNDSVPPQVHAIRVYPQQGMGVYNGSADTQELTDSATAWGQIGFAICADDYMQNSKNYYGIRHTKLLVDGREVFNADVNGIPYSNNRMVNSWGDYDYYHDHSRWFLKSFIEPGNTLPILAADEHRGIIDINEEREYHFEYVLTDYFGNTTRKAFVVRGTPHNLHEDGEGVRGVHSPTIGGGRDWLRWNSTNVFSRPGMQLVVPYGYVGKDFPLHPAMENDEGLSPVFSFTRKSCPLFYDAELSIALRREVKDPTKLYIVCHYGKDIYMGGSFQEGWVMSSVRDLGGSYELAYDDVPPVIEPYNSDSWSNGTVTLKVTDEQSGLKGIKGYVDGRFVLFRPVAKSDRMTCRLGDTPVRRTGSTRRLKVVATDNRDNQQTFETTIKY